VWIGMTGATLTRHAHGQLLTAAQLAADGKETGGILLGHDQGMAGGFVIRHCGDPGPRAVRQRAHFERDLAHAQKLADQAADRDGSVWLGEWHTHLLELPVPSLHDLMTYRALLFDVELGFPRFLSLIVLSGPGGEWSCPRIFAWSVTASSMGSLAVAVEQPC
jgi:integrative and conjugative element protein (TIGR02256 family)